MGQIYQLTRRKDMKGKNFEIHASPNFQRVRCPKHGNDMVELDNGWFSVCWDCQECGYTYELELRKMSNIKKENLDSLLKEKGITE